MTDRDSKELCNESFADALSDYPCSFEIYRKYLEINGFWKHL